MTLNENTSANDRIQTFQVPDALVIKLPGRSRTKIQREWVWIEFYTTLMLSRLTLHMKSRASYPMPVTLVKKLMEELVSSLRIYRTNRPWAGHNLYTHISVTVFGFINRPIYKNMHFSNTFSSLRSFPVVKNSSIFSAIFAPTPSWEEKKQFFIKSNVNNKVLLTFQDNNTIKIRVCTSFFASVPFLIFCGYLAITDAAFLNTKHQTGDKYRLHMSS